jgi:peptide/nickel transport system ATP-binding protein
MNNDNNTFLKINNLWVEYTSDEKVIHAVNGVSLSLKRGSTLGLVGETGAGKTTIAKSILRILPEFTAKIKSGEINLDDEDLINLSELEMRKIRGHKVSMIFQDPMTALNPTMSVGDQITEAICIHNDISKNEAKKQTEKMLELVGIPKERYEGYPFQFSGGMKQRIVIAMALACNPELLLADEPTTALDVTIQAQVLEMIKKLKDERDMAMIMITHDLGIVAEVCDEVAVIYAGEIIEYGPKIELFDHPKHPYTLGLFAALPSIKNRSKKLNPIFGLPPDPTRLPSGCYFHPRCKYAKDECEQNKPIWEEVGPDHFCRCILCEKTET